MLKQVGRQLSFELILMLSKPVEIVRAEENCVDGWNVDARHESLAVFIHFTS
jgi:hypothetical protein